MTFLRTAGFVPALLLLAVAASAAAGPPSGDYGGQYRGMHVILRLGPGAIYRMVGPNNAVLVQGTYTATGQQIAFTDKTGPISDKSKGAGRYRWTLAGGKLTLRVVTDALTGRKDCLTGTPWTRAPAHH